jgi:hypothetical protein
MIYVDGKVGRKSEYKTMSVSTFLRLIKRPDVRNIYDDCEYLYQRYYSVYVNGHHVFGCDSYDECRARYSGKKGVCIYMVESGTAIRNRLSDFKDKYTLVYPSIVGC